MTDSRSLDGGKRITEAYQIETRRLALEAIQWRTKGKQAAQMLTIYSYAAGLPLQWWRKRDTHSLAEIIRAVEREMESPCPLQK